jgi:hypothetical protein
MRSETWPGSGPLKSISRGSQLFRLQLHRDSSYTSHVPGEGRWRHGSFVERGGPGSPLGILRAAEGRKSRINEPMGISNRVRRSVRGSSQSQAGDHPDAEYAGSRRLGGRHQLGKRRQVLHSFQEANFKVAHYPCRRDPRIAGNASRIGVKTTPRPRGQAVRSKTSSTAKPHSWSSHSGT